MGSVHPRTLIIDDDPEFVCQLSSVLSSAGFETTTAVDGDSAARILMEKDAAFDVLIVDLVLPGSISGFDVISAVTRTKPPFKVIAASAVFRDSVLEYIARNLGVDAFVEKIRPGGPFNGPAWIEAVRQVLGMTLASVGGAS